MPDLISVLDVHGLAYAACPTNGLVGKRVAVQTLQAMLKRSLNLLRTVEYRFCPDPNCPTVYYSVDGAQTFIESDLRERVFQKHPQDANVMVCYCFQHTVGELRASNEMIVREINEGVERHQCACDIRNPQGSCCLGNVNSLVKNIQAVL